MTEFTVEAAAGANRIIVRWEQEASRFHFMARVEGDDIVEIQHGTYQRFPTIYEKQPHGGRRAGLHYHSAENERFAPIVSEAIQHIARHKMATAARAQITLERQQREAAAISNKAQFMRNVIIPLIERDDRVSLAGVADSALAEAYDRIQNGVL